VASETFADLLMAVEFGHAFIGFLEIGKVNSKENYVPNINNTYAV